MVKPKYYCPLLRLYYKNCIGRRDIKVQNKVCVALIRHAHKRIDEWISLDTILHGNYLDIQIAEENPKILK